MSWQRIRGHEFWVCWFADVAKRSRLAHAYLFAGPAGIGKKLFAFELAKTLLCESRFSLSHRRSPSGRDGDFAACDQCPSCHLVTAETHPDVIFAFRPEDKVEFPIAVMREIGRAHV